MCPTNVFKLCTNKLPDDEQQLVRMVLSSLTFSWDVFFSSSEAAQVTAFCADGRPYHAHDMYTAPQSELTKFST